MHCTMCLRERVSATASNYHTLFSVPAGFVPFWVVAGHLLPNMSKQNCTYGSLSTPYPKMTPREAQTLLQIHLM